MSIGVGNHHRYIDEREKLDYILKMEDDILFNWLGLRAFQIEQYGYYDPNKILKKDFFALGKKTYEKYIEIVKSKICPYWKQMRESGYFNDMKDIFTAVLGALLGQGVPYALAIVIAAIVARRGLDRICKV